MPGKTTIRTLDDKRITVREDYTEVMDKLVEARAGQTATGLAEFTQVERHLTRTEEDSEAGGWLSGVRAAIVEHPIAISPDNIARVETAASLTTGRGQG